MTEEEKVSTVTERCSCGAEVNAEAATCESCGALTAGFTKAFDTMVEDLRKARGERSQVRKQEVVREAVQKLASYARAGGTGKKGNPYHDKGGRFSSRANQGTGGGAAQPAKPAAGGGFKGVLGPRNLAPLRQMLVSEGKMTQEEITAAYQAMREEFHSKGTVTMPKKLKSALASVTTPKEANDLEAKLQAEAKKLHQPSKATLQSGNAKKTPAKATPATPATPAKKAPAKAPVKATPATPARPSLRAGNAKRKTTKAAEVKADNTPWDGGAAMSAAGQADDPATAFRAICAGEHSVGEPDQRQHWALPHHKAPGSPPNTAGVGQALARVNQTQDLKNPAAAKKHLQDHSDAIHGR